MVAGFKGGEKGHLWVENLPCTFMELSLGWRGVGGGGGGGCI